MVIIISENKLQMEKIDSTVILSKDSTAMLNSMLMDVDIIKIFIAN
jgi:hypothetical protein